MLHFKQLSKSSAPPPHRKKSLPQNIKKLKTELWLVRKDKHPSSKVLAVFHIFSALPQFPTTSSPTTLAEYLNSFQECTQRCACHLVHVVHSPPYLLSKGKAVFAVKCFGRVLFWGIIHIFRFSVSTQRLASWGSPYIRLHMGRAWMGRWKNH